MEDASMGWTDCGGGGVEEEGVHEEGAAKG